jgi:hypothetical protein
MSFVTTRKAQSDESSCIRNVLCQGWQYSPISISLSKHNGQWIPTAPGTARADERRAEFCADSLASLPASNAPYTVDLRTSRLLSTLMLFSCISSFRFSFNKGSSLQIKRGSSLSIIRVNVAQNVDNGCPTATTNVLSFPTATTRPRSTTTTRSTSSASNHHGPRHGNNDHHTLPAIKPPLSRLIKAGRVVACRCR